jgi:DNA-directed RNA polymerase specialized sigma24 family protein
MHDISDLQLMSRLASGEDLALNVLMDRWAKRLNAFLYRMTGQHEVAVDLTQEAFVRLYKARKRFRPKGVFSTYLFSIAANLGRNTRPYLWTRLPRTAGRLFTKSVIPLRGQMNMRILRNAMSR